MKTIINKIGATLIYILWVLKGSKKTILTLLLGGVLLTSCEKEPLETIEHTCHQTIIEEITETLTNEVIFGSDTMEINELRVFKQGDKEVIPGTIDTRTIDGSDTSLVIWVEDGQGQFIQLTIDNYIGTGTYYFNELPSWSNDYVYGDNEWIYQSNSSFNFGDGGIVTTKQVVGSIIVVENDWTNNFKASGSIIDRGSVIKFSFNNNDNMTFYDEYTN